MVQVIIAEKPSAAAKIAYALGADIPKKNRKVSYFTNERGSLIVACAVGHLFGLSKKRGAKYPNFSLEWTPNYLNVSGKFSKPYFDILTSISKKVDELIVATDYDIEGEVIGLNIMRYIFGKKDASRMKFSTLTPSDLKEAYDLRSKSIDWGQAHAGETRHYLDWYYGINLSNALSKAVASAENKRIILSIGRVQGPSLALLSERELEIKKFKPVPYWDLKSKIKIKGSEFIAEYSKNELWNKTEASSLLNKSKDGKAIVFDLKTSVKKVLPPFPFDLTSLQLESFRVFGFSPKRTLSIAQELYSRAYISYPRTSSQKLPAKLGFKKILESLSKQIAYKELVKKVLKTSLHPTEGNKTDPAHPAIYPTGQRPAALKEDEKKVYDLIVKRFLSVFGEEGERTTDKIEFDINGLLFNLSGIRTTKKGWMEWYTPYSRRKEEELPIVNKKDSFSQKSILEDKETTPPRRYTPASIISELEKRNLGTKATRANIIEILFDRTYIEGKSISVTELGLKLYSSLKKYAPTVLSDELTRWFEDEMEKIREKKSTTDTVLKKAKVTVTSIYDEIKKHDKLLGKELYEAFVDVRKEQTELMTCPKCKKGKMIIRFSRKTKKRFLACNAYPKCMNCWPLPQNGKLDFLDKTCEECGARKIAIYKARSKPWFICPNPNCKTKKEYNKAKEVAIKSTKTKKIK